MRFAVLAATVAALSGCALAQHDYNALDPAQQADLAGITSVSIGKDWDAVWAGFESTDYAPYRQTGRTSIEGQAFLRTRGGDIVTCAGSEVFAMPATDYFRRITFPARAKRGLDRFPAEAASLIRVSICDSQGNFSIANLPAGSWRVMTDVSWSAGYEQQGGYLAGEIETGAAPAKIILSEPSRL